MLDLTPCRICLVSAEMPAKEMILFERQERKSKEIGKVRYVVI